MDQLDGSYEWVNPADWRVAEVHLLRGAEDRDDRAEQNLLIQGDALAALRSLGPPGSARRRVIGEVNLQPAEMALIAASSRSQRASGGLRERLGGHGDLDLGWRHAQTSRRRTVWLTAGSREHEKRWVMAIDGAQPQPATTRTASRFPATTSDSHHPWS
jgi:hypothetical protein